MSNVDRADGSRAADLASETRRADDQKKSGGFDAFVKARSKDPDKADEKKKDDAGVEEKGEGQRSETAGAEKKRVEGRGSDGRGQGEKGGQGGREGSGQGGLDRAHGKPPLAKKPVEAPGKAQKKEGPGALGEAKPKPRPGILGTRDADLGSTLAKKGKQSEDLSKANLAEDREAAQRIDKPGEVGSSKLAQRDDKKTMQEEIARNMFPGEVPHPFMLQQPAVAPVERVERIPPELVDRIVERARFGLNAEGAHEFQIDLKQDVYAGLSMKVATKDGKVSIDMIAPNEDVRADFEAKAAGMAKALEARGLKVDRVTVSLAERGGPPPPPSGRRPSEGYP